MQLVAYGAQDIYLTGNPQITFFKVVYRRHTNFSMETIRQTLNGATTAAAGATASCTISRNGDLVYKTYVSFAAIAGDINGSKLIKEVELEIGGQRIDRHYQEWNEVWNELSTPESKAVGLKAMQLEIGTGSGTGVNVCQVPLNFWFCRNPGLALPLIALQYHEVKLKFTWDDPGGGSVKPDVWCDYIYLDTDERRRFAQVSHEYLIEQIQKEDKTLTGTGSSETHKLNFNHPVKELIWTYGAANTMTDVKLKLNGHDRFAAQPDEYFTLKQPLDYHTAVPRQNLPTSGQLTSNVVDLNTTDFLTNNLTTDFAPADSGSSNIAAVTNANTFGLVITDKTGTEALTASVILSNVSAGGAGGVLATAGSGAQAFWAAAHAAGKAAFIVKLSEAVALSGLNGRLVQITGTGLNSTNTTTMIATIIFAGKGPEAASTDTADSIADDNGLIYFDRQIVPTASISDSAATVDSGFTITKIQVFQPDSTLANEARTSKMIRKIGVYSFALKPEEHQPSGTCNFSRIDNAQLLETNSNKDDPTLTIYAVNYNVLRIMSGMGGLAYSN